MALINVRWPRDICPTTCKFTRSRNDVPQVSPATRAATFIRRGRPLWRAECNWQIPNIDRLAKLRYYLESLDGFAGSVQLWDFSSPYPWGLNLPTADAAGSRLFWINSGTTLPWTFGGLPYQWQADSVLSLSASAAAGATSVSVTGCTPSTLVAVQGQYVQVGRRLYLAAATVTSNGSGAATISLVSGLVSAVAAGSEVRLVEAACEMRLDSQDFEAGAQAGDGFVSVSATFVETWTDFS